MQTLARHLLGGGQCAWKLGLGIPGTPVLVAKTIQFPQAIRTVHMGGGLQRLTKGPGRSLANEQSWWRLHQSEDTEQVLGALLDRHVSTHGGDRDHLQFRRAQRE